MKAQDVTAWFLDFATRLVEIQHTDDNKKFAHNIDEAREGQRSKITMSDFTLVMNEPKGIVEGIGMDNWHDRNVYGFWILKKLKNNDFAQEDVVYDGAKVILFQMLAKMKKERDDFFESGTSGLMKYVDLDNVEYRKAGPEFNNCFGLYCTIRFSDNINAQLLYDPAHYIA